ncbi:MAG TPA: hypothetical protein VFD38_09660 [Myxococcaceae bacterium]|nr:hypothetical protein [Myxococcaceae bacterium]
MATSPQNPSSGNGQHQQGFVGRVGHLNDSAHQLFDEARSTFEDLGQAIDLRGRVQRHPYAMVAAALGVGYVLGGGLFSSLTFRVFGLGVRVAAIPLVKNQLLGLAEAAVSGFTAGGTDDVGSPS